MKLTTKTIASIDTSVDRFCWDASLPGFAVRTRGGKLSYIVQYRTADRSTRRMKIGDCGVLALDQARIEAKRILAEAALGRDPQAQRIEQRRGPECVDESFRQVAEQYLQAKECRSIRPNTLRDVRRYLLAGPYFLTLHDKGLDAIARKDIASALTRIEIDHGMNVAWSARKALVAFFSWSMMQGLCSANPVIGAAKIERGAPRSRVLTLDELRSVWRACNGNDDFSRIARLLILSACRRAEIAGLMWHEVDFSKSTITISPERSKNGKPHVLPLPAIAFDILRAVPRLLHRDHVFGESPRGFLSFHKGRKRIEARSGVSNWVLHDLRRSTATHMAEAGIASPHIIEAILRHPSGTQVARIYNRADYVPQVRAALGTWADHVSALIDGGEKKIVQMRRERLTVN